MKNLMPFIFIFVFSLGVHASSSTGGGGAVPRPNQFGLGGMVGTIFSVTGKYWLSNQGALDFGLGWVGSPWMAVYGDYLWHLPKVFGTGTRFGRESALYFGGGGGLGFWNDSGRSCGHWRCDWDSGTKGTSGTGVFIRGLAGVEWYPAPTRFGVFGEAGPAIMVTPGTWTTFDVGVGGRWYF